MSSHLFLVLCAVFTLGGCSREPSSKQRAEWDRELAALGNEVDALESRLRQMNESDPQRALLPDGDVVLVIPPAFLAGAIDRVFSGLASQVTLRLEGIHARWEKSFRKGIPIGDLSLDVLIDEVHGEVRPGPPRASFADNQINLRLPAHVPRGAGRATIRLRWNGRSVVGAVCRDLDVTRPVWGTVRPIDAVLSGTLQLSTEGESVIGTPRFPDTRIQIRITPSKESWAEIDDIISTRTDLCARILRSVDVKKQLAQLIEEQGFAVKLPLHNIKPFRFPASFSNSVVVGGKRLALDVEATTLRVDAAAVRVGARMSVVASPDVPSSRTP